MSAIRFTRAGVSRKYIKEGVTIGDLLRLTCDVNGLLITRETSGNARQRRKARRQIERAIAGFKCKRWLSDVHKANAPAIKVRSTDHD